MSAVIYMSQGSEPEVWAEYQFRKMKALMDAGFTRDEAFTFVLKDHLAIVGNMSLVFATTEHTDLPAMGGSPNIC